MSYGHRMSQQFHGSQQQRNNRGGGRKKEDENDALMRLVSSYPALSRPLTSISWFDCILIYSWYM